MNDLVVKALAWAQLAAGQLPPLPQAAHMTSDRPQPNSPGTFRDALALPGGKHLSTLWTCYNEGPQERLSPSSGQPLSPLTQPVPCTPCQAGD